MKHQRRMGSKTSDESTIVETLAAQLPEPPTDKLREKETVAMATLLRRDPQTVARWIGDARAQLQERAGRYAEIHHEAVEAALASGENEVAAKESRQMLERLADDSGRRIIDSDKQQAGSGLVVQVGVQLGGTNRNGPIVEEE